MTDVCLPNIEGSKRLGTIDSIYRYAQERGVAGAATKARLAGLPISEEGYAEVVAATIPQLTPERYIGELVSSFMTGVEPTPLSSRTAAVGELEETALTNLFEERYGADFSRIKAFGLFRLFGVSQRNTGYDFEMNYQVHSKLPSESARGGSFWQLVISETFGFINMYSVGRQTPTSGETNITSVPGVNEALAIDLATLIELNDYKITT